MIFQMNEAGEILSMNKTAHAHAGFLHLKRWSVKRLYDFVPDGLEGDIELNRNIVREHVRLFLEEKTLVNFRTTLRKKAHVRARRPQRHAAEEPDTLAGRDSRQSLAPARRRVSQRFLEKEKGQYRITNNVTHAEILSQKICERLNRYFSYPVVNTIRICFREILINAIEHGNLGITFDEKTRAIENGDYMDFLISRQKDPKFARRGVLVDYLINGKVLMFRITDEGDGFDHGGFITRAENDENMAMLEHGRGIIMTRNVFDSVVFNEKGNQVILTKRIPQ
jgi:hypothetical protein